MSLHTKTVWLFLFVGIIVGPGFLAPSLAQGPQIPDKAQLIDRLDDFIKRAGSRDVCVTNTTCLVALANVKDLRDFVSVNEFYSEKSFRLMSLIDVVMRVAQQLEATPDSDSLVKLEESYSVRWEKDPECVKRCLDTYIDCQREGGYSSAHPSCVEPLNECSNSCKI